MCSYVGCLDLLASRVLLDGKVDSGCSTVVEQAPHDRKIVGLNPASRWSLFSLHPISSALQIRSFVEVNHFTFSYEKYAKPCSLMQREVNTYWFSQKKACSVFELARTCRTSWFCRGWVFMLSLASYQAECQKAVVNELQATIHNRKF